MPKNMACRVCGCTDEFGCAEGCEWVQPGLCSACLSSVRAIRCTDCGSSSKFCRRPSGHSGPMVAYHSARIIDAARTTKAYLR